MQPERNVNEGRSPMRPMPVFGCVAFVVLAGLAGAFAVGGSFWGWIGLGALLLIGGVAVIIYFIRQNTRSAGPPS